MLDIHPDEKIVAELRKHWIGFFAESLPLLLFAFIPFLIWPFLILYVDASSLTRAEPFFLFLTCGWLLSLWITLFIFWTNYYLDVLVITNKRIVNVDQLTFFSREISECRLERIQDVSIEVLGFMATTLHYGILHIQTAGEAEEFVIPNVPDPYAAKDLIAKMHDEALKKNKEAVEDPD